jgi:molybdopterin molybdotransferase
LAEDIRTESDIPGFDRSTVDGFALHARDTVGASDALPAFLRYRGSIPMGAAPALTLQSDECAYIPTGGVLPPGADAVAMVEYSEQIDDRVLVHRSVAAGENVLRRDEDFPKGSVILPAGHLVRPQDMGVMAAAGATRVAVYRIPRIGVISTGNELIPVEKSPAAGEVRDANSFMIGGFLTEHGCRPCPYGIIPDDPSLLRDTLARVIRECDAVILSGGSSKDIRDMSARIIGEMGEVLVHGISLQPGKPTIIGKVGGIPVIGLPGHPASAYIVLMVVVRPFLEDMTLQAFPITRIPATLTENIPSPKGREDYVRVQVKDGMATPLLGKSGLLNTLVHSEGMVRIPAQSEGLEEGEMVEVLLW